jgi:subtilisin family serine protease
MKNIRQAVAITPIGGPLPDAYRELKPSAILELLESLFREGGYDPKPGDYDWVIPTGQWTLEVADESTGTLKPETPQKVTSIDIGLIFHSEEAVNNARKAVQDGGRGGISIIMGADIPFQTTDCWCPGEAADPIFGNRKDANEIINASSLWENGLDGRNVNVVIIDRGLDPAHIPITGRWQFPTANQVSVPTPDNHAMMVARHIQKIAPKAYIFDCALLPEHISDIGQFLVVARSGYVQMLADISNWIQNHSRSTEWVFINAWAIFNRQAETPPGDYSNNPSHPFNLIVQDAAVTHNVDLVFAAGNCGSFCPKMNCGRNDRGPGQSIFGANSHADVLTTGAIRTDNTWLGYSSQGPGQNNLKKEKPDLCVPSQFREVEDAHLVNTGTSASCALAAGVIAALRSRPGWNSNRISPADMRRYLIQNAGKYPDWTGKLGYGLLDAEATFQDLNLHYP